MTTKDIAYEVVKMLDSKKGQKLRLLKIDRVSSLADYFVICTGTSNTHVRTLCDLAEDTLEKLGVTFRKEEEKIQEEKMHVKETEEMELGIDM